VTLPPLRERLEELPWLVAAEFARAGPALTPRASLIETCLLRPWPGNVRELSSEMRRIAAQAVASGQSSVGASSLGADAGVSFEKDAVDAADGTRALPETDTIEAALREHSGNVSRAARALGLHRNQLRRWLAKNGRPELSAPGDGEPDR
jgi:transcriptional regulator with PAS, ATPase and Fis domain